MKISISLNDSKKGEQKAQSCENVCLRHYDLGISCGTMDSDETSRIWDEYRRRRIQAFTLFIAAFVVPAILGLIARIESRIGLVIAFVVLLATYVLFGISVTRFWNWKCPRCGHRFMGFYGGFSFLRRKCFHCGLRIGYPPSDKVAVPGERF